MKQKITPEVCTAGQGRLNSLYMLGISMRNTLHKFSKVRGFHIHALDGEIGHVDDFLLDESTWSIRYLVVDTANWIGGKRVLVSPQVVIGVDHEHERIDVSLTRDQIKHSKSIESADVPLDEVLPTIWVM